MKSILAHRHMPDRPQKIKLVYVTTELGPEESLRSQTRRQVVTLSRKVTIHTAYLGNNLLVASVSVLAGWGQFHITSLVQFATKTHRVSCLPPPGVSPEFLSPELSSPTAHCPVHCNPTGSFRRSPLAKAANFLRGPHSVCVCC